MLKDPDFSISLIILAFCCFCNCHPGGYEHLIVIFICISLIINDLEHLFLCLLPFIYLLGEICICFLSTCQLGCLILCWGVAEVSLYILDITLFPGLFANIVSHSMCYHFCDTVLCYAKMCLVYKFYKFNLIFMILGIKPRPLCVLGKCSSTELQSQS